MLPKTKIKLLTLSNPGRSHQVTNTLQVVQRTALLEVLFYRTDHYFEGGVRGNSAQDLQLQRQHARRQNHHPKCYHTTNSVPKLQQRPKAC